MAGSITRPPTGHISVQVLRSWTNATLATFAAEGGMCPVGDDLLILGYGPFGVAPLLRVTTDGVTVDSAAPGALAATLSGQLESVAVYDDDLTLLIGIEGAGLARTQWLGGNNFSAIGNVAVGTLAEIDPYGCWRDGDDLTVVNDVGSPPRLTTYDATELVNGVYDTLLTPTDFEIPGLVAPNAETGRFANLARFGAYWLLAQWAANAAITAIKTPATIHVLSSEKSTVMQTLLLPSITSVRMMTVARNGLLYLRTATDTEGRVYEARLTIG